MADSDAPLSANIATATAPVVVAAVTSTAGKPWVEKYRPGSLDDVVAHEEILTTLRKLMVSDCMPHVLFYGPPGTGKTTTIQACARQLFGQQLKGNVLELNASDDRGIDVVRNEIKDFASTSAVLFSAQNASHTPFKLIILDEADQMSSEAQAALRRVIEKYTKTVRFCIICNHVNKIIPAVQSRCTRFRFGPVKKEHMLPRLAHICTSESLQYEDAGLDAAYRLSNGDMRRCVNMLQASAMSLGEVTENSVYQATGNPTPMDVKELLDAMLSQDLATAWTDVSCRVSHLGLSVADLLREFHTWVLRAHFDTTIKCFCFVRLAEVEANLSVGGSENVALGAILGVFQLVREAVTTNTPIQKVTLAAGVVFP